MLQGPRYHRHRVQGDMQCAVPPRRRPDVAGAWRVPEQACRDCCLQACQQRDWSQSDGTEQCFGRTEFANTWSKRREEQWSTAGFDRRRKLGGCCACDIFQDWVRGVWNSGSGICYRHVLVGWGHKWDNDWAGFKREESKIMKEQLQVFGHKIQNSVLSFVPLGTCFQNEKLVSIDRTRFSYKGFSIAAS